MIQVIRGVLGAGASLCCVGQQGRCKEVKAKSVKSSEKKKTPKTCCKGVIIAASKMGGKFQCKWKEREV